MAENTANESNVQSDAHDRVVMLSLRADGTPDQLNPEIIGDKEFAEEAAKRQFAEQAVSAADEVRVAAAVAAETVEQDPTIKAAKAENEKVAQAAERKAAAVVTKLHKS